MNNCNGTEEKLSTNICEICNKVLILCECQKEWGDFDNILESQCSGNLDIEDTMKFSPLRVSTMTLCFKFNQSINLKNLKENAPSSVNLNYKPESKKSRNPKKKGSESFYNSLDIKMSFVDFKRDPEVVSNISIMMFPNGQVKIAGCKTINTCPLVLSELKAMLIGIEGVIKEPETLDIERTKIVMICSDFEAKPNKENITGWCINQEILKNILVNEYSLSATYSTLNRYPGINLKYPSKIRQDKNTSLLIFRSGSIIITGASEVCELVDAYKFICQCLTNYVKEIFYFDSDEVNKKKKKRSINNISSKKIVAIH